MNRESSLAGRFALTAVCAAALVAITPDARALGLGRLSVQSALGESLRAEIDITSLTAEEAGSLNVRVASPDAYKAAGVDYNSVLPATQTSLQRRADGRPYLRIASDRNVQEPFVDVILEMSWSSGRLVREYTMLFDPPTARAPAAPPVTTAPTIAAAPPAPPAVAPAAPSPAPRPAPAPRPPIAAEAPAPAPRPAQAPQPAPAIAKAPASTEGGEYRVRAGDSLSRIAARTQQPGVSLDQMLVALYRSNPQAFIDNNMNRLKAGSVLAVPSADAARGTTPAEARQVIQAQSADFGAYRQRLAGGVPTAPTESNARQSTGKVQAAVDDKKAAAPTPDKLTLSKGEAVKASAPEATLSKEQEAKASASRVAELAKNVEQLKKLQDAASATASKPPVAAAPAPAPAPAPVPAPPPAPVAPPPAPAPAPAAPASVQAPTVVAAAPPAPTPAPAPVASAPEPAPAPVPVPAPKPAPAAASAAPTAGTSEESGGLSSWLDNPLILSVGGVLVALLAGLGFYRLRNKVKKDSGETSFLESRLQPDSFFGASGGQRIDTRDAGGASSSMSYSLSQLDAIGDVDPVAEADVYLAYGRDLQAEEILKEAMRANPERLAVRTKLLEVYAKRRDAKGFELLATQLYALTRGEGEDWAKAQELGQQIDPENTLYQPGGRPQARSGAEGDAMVEPLGASTMPQSVLPTPSKFTPTAQPRESSFGLDLDLDLDLASGAQVAPPRAPEVTQPFRNDVQPASNSLDFDLSDETTQLRTPAAPSQPATMDFNLDDLQFGNSSPAPAPTSTFGLDDGNDDPLARKLELAEEFRQIGDMEGARDLLQEVVSKADGALKSRAQGMLDDIS